MPGSIGPTSESISRMLPMLETTLLTPDEEEKFRRWASFYGVKDVSPEGKVHSDVYYDTRGYWKENQGPSRMIGYGPVEIPGAHGPDKWKQHGHPAFSQESKYWTGPADKDTYMWIPGSETRLKQPRMSRSSR